MRLAWIDAVKEQTIFDIQGIGWEDGQAEAKCDVDFACRRQRFNRYSEPWRSKISSTALLCRCSQWPAACHPTPLAVPSQTSFRLDQCHSLHSSESRSSAFSTAEPSRHQMKGAVVSRKITPRSYGFPPFPHLCHSTVYDHLNCRDFPSSNSVLSLMLGRKWWSLPYEFCNHHLRLIYTTAAQLWSDRSLYTFHA